MEKSSAAQNEYSQYKKLYALENIALEYQLGKEYAANIQELVKQIETQRYRVAVIGEFKRGKSSMINALLGAEILPTDILPMTAAVNRIVYGTKKEILIQYKDGQTRHAEIDDLISYATKYDEQKALQAEKVKEIVVSYPSVFCKNHIEIYDTPGLNDDEPMTETTLGILKDIDAAIVVLSAVMPLSMTEQNLIIQLLRYREIHNIIFVVTFIDAVSSRKSEQDKVIQFLKKRISENVLQEALSLQEEEDGFHEKARRILEEPQLYAVSSVMALKGFVQDDEELVEKSRFPEFKYSLLESLTAGQSLGVAEKVSKEVAEVEKRLKDWYELEDGKQSDEMEKNEHIYRQCMKYLDDADKTAEQLFAEADADLESNGIAVIAGSRRGMLAESLRKPFIRELSCLRVGAAAEQIQAAIEKGSGDALELINRTLQSMWNDGNYQLTQSTNFFLKLREEALVKRAESLWHVSLPSVTIQVPADRTLEFLWNGPLYPQNLDLLQEDVISHINHRILESLDEYGRRYESYVAAWRKTIIDQNRIDCKNRTLLLEEYEKKRKELQTQREVIRFQYQKHVSQIEELR